MKKLLCIVGLILSLSLISTVHADIVGHWSLDEGSGPTAYDNSVYGNDGTLGTAGVSWTTGYYGFALNFTPPDGCVLIPDSASLDITNAFTVMAWVNLNDLTGPKSIVSKFRSGDASFILKKHNSNDKFRVQLWNDLGSMADLSSSTSSQVGAWTHVAVTYNGSVLQFYYNGDPDGSMNVSGSLHISSSPVVIGAIEDGNGENFDGVIDEVRIYSHALSPTEVIEAMNTGSGQGESPIAEAGDDIIAAGDETILLDGSNSYDPDGTIVSYEWKRLPDSEILYSGADPTCQTDALGRAEELVELKVVDDVGNTGTDTMTVLNSRVNLLPPELAYIGSRVVYIGSTLTFQISATDPEEFNLAYSASNLPPGATFDENTQTFSWTPDTTGSYPDVRFEVTDSLYIDYEIIIIIARRSGPGPCFLAGTPILMSNGSTKPIEDIKVDDMILAYDVDSGKIIEDKVSEVFIHDADNYLIINNELKATPNHPVYSNGEWVEIGTLKIGDKLLNSKSEYQEIKTIKRVKADVRVYNFEVNPYHTYIANGYVVHNKVYNSVVADPLGGDFQ